MGAFFSRVETSGKSFLFPFSFTFSVPLLRFGPSPPFLVGPNFVLEGQDFLNGCSESLGAEPPLSPPCGLHSTHFLIRF